MDWLIYCMAVALAAAAALVGSVRFAPSVLSEAELARRVAAGEPHAKHEAARRPLLSLLLAWQRLKIIGIVAVLVTLLVSTQGWGMGLATSLVLLIGAEIVQARSWLHAPAKQLQRTIENYAFSHIGIVASIRFMAPPPLSAKPVHVASRAELEDLIRHHAPDLQEDEKHRLLNSLHFTTLAVADIMVPAAQIATVPAEETVSPLLLDRLHKTGHNIFPVIEKDINNIKGLLYMSDLVPLNPAINDVHDALRPRVHYLSPKASVIEVLQASLQTGRQLFIVADDTGMTLGLVTLGDALEKLFGYRLQVQGSVRTEPQQKK